MDTLSKKRRSEQMAKVRSKHTKPEVAVRKLLKLVGIAWSRHVRSLPGSPDFVFKSEKKVVFVHGCFWHRHKNCKAGRVPKSKVKFWTQKLEANRKRDLRNQRQLRALGWKYLVVWECHLKRSESVERRIKKFFGG